MIAAEGIRFERTDGLHARAAAALREGPLGTPELARRVMGLHGAPEVAARAVWALLGTDARFVVSAQGVWSLAGAPARVREPEPVYQQTLALIRRLRDEEWSVVDVETTGGTPEMGHRITEVAAVRVAGGEIRDSYATLVNPGRPIPRVVSTLTGITQGMVDRAPRFGQVAGEVAQAIGGKIFVAHNAGFDWRFVSHEMQRATGTAPAGRMLCTVKLAKKLLPELPSRGLDGLALWFGLEIERRHRALDDALATARVLIRFIEMLEEKGVDDWEGLQALLRRRAQRRPRRRRATPRSMDAA